MTIQSNVGLHLLNGLPPVCSVFNLSFQLVIFAFFNKDIGITFHQNNGNYLPVDMVWHPSKAWIFNNIITSYPKYTFTENC